MMRLTSTAGSKNAAQATTAAQNLCRGKSPIERAIERAGSRAAFAESLGVTVQAVCQWVRRGWLPPARALEIEKLYAVPRAEMMKPALRAIMDTPRRGAGSSRGDVL
jgi:DNA-binding transcriptional regulator YdaS (Cro superfamily)